MDTHDEIRTDFVWNTEGAERGERVYEQLLDKMGNAEKAADNASAERDKRAEQRRKMTPPPLPRRAEEHGHAGNGSRRYAGDIINAATGTSGNVNRLGMLGHLLPGVSAGAAGAGLAAFGVATRGVENLREELKAAGAESARLDSRMQSLSRAALFDNAGRGAEALTSRAAQFHEQLEAEGTHAYETARSREKLSKTLAIGTAISTYGLSLLAPRGKVGELATSAVGGVREMFGGESYETMERGSNLRSKAAKAGESRAVAYRRQALSEEAETGEMNLNGDPLLARMRGVEFARKHDETTAKEGNYSQEEIGNLSTIRNQQRESLMRERDRRDIGLNSSARLAGINAGGEDVEVKAAREKLDAAKNREQTFGLGSPELKDAQTKTKEAETELEIVKRQVELRAIESSTARATADFRGGAEERALVTARAHLHVAEEQRRLARTDVEINAGDAAVAAARLGVLQTGLGIDAQRIGLGAGIAQGARTRSSRQFEARSATDSADEGVRFRAEQANERERAQAAVDNAKTALEAAKAKAASEAKAGGISDPTAAAVTRAEQERDAAVAQQTITTKALNAADRERNVSLGRELAATKNTTEAQRLEILGRDDLARRSRRQFEAEDKAAEFDRTGHPEMAAQTRAQLAQGNLGDYNSTYLTDDGRPNAPAANQAFRKAEGTERRRLSEDDKLMRNFGLREVHFGNNGEAADGIDPVTHRRRAVTDADRKASKDYFDRKKELEKQGIHGKELRDELKKPARMADLVPVKDRGQEFGKAMDTLQTTLAASLTALQKSIEARLPVVGATP